MKKGWAMSDFIALMIVGLAGCGSNDANSNKSAAVEKIKFSSDASYAPMEYMDTDTIKGFDIDFIKAVMEEAGLSYEVTNTGWDTMLTSVKQGTEYQADYPQYQSRTNVKKHMTILFLILNLPI
jgi:glutamine transport system substrate-binding protein